MSSQLEPAELRFVKELRVDASNAAVQHIAPLDGGQRVVWLDDMGGLWLVDVDSSMVLGRTPDGDDSAIEAFTLLGAEGAIVASRGYALELWSVDNLVRPAQSFVREGALGQALVVHPDRSRIAVLDDEPKVEIWDVHGGELVAAWNVVGDYPPPTGLATSITGTELYTFGPRQPVQRWGWNDGTPCGTADTFGSRQLAVHPDGDRLVFPSLVELIVWELRTGEEQHRCPHRSLHCSSVALLDRGRYAVAGHGDGMMALWEVATGRLVSEARAKRTEHIESLFALDAVRFALVPFGRESRVEIWTIDPIACVQHAR